MVNVAFSSPLEINEKGYAGCSAYIPSIGGYILINASILTWKSGGIPY